MALITARSSEGDNKHTGSTGWVASFGASRVVSTADENSPVNNISVIPR